MNQENIGHNIMRIVLKSMITSKNYKFGIAPEMLKLRLFKPDGLPTSLILTSNVRFEVETYQGDMSLNQFLTEIGFFISNKEITDNLETLKKVYDFLITAEIEHAPARIFGDNSNSAILAREVLKECPHCSEQEFKEIAFDLYKALGFSKQDYQDACKWYS